MDFIGSLSTIPSTMTLNPRGRDGRVVDILVFGLVGLVWLVWFGWFGWFGWFWFVSFPITNKVFQFNYKYITKIIIYPPIINGFILEKGACEKI